MTRRSIGGAIASSIGAKEDNRAMLKPSRALNPAPLDATFSFTSIMTPKSMLHLMRNDWLSGLGRSERVFWIEIAANSTLRPAQVEVELVQPPAQPGKTESQFDSLSIYHKGPRTHEECIP